MATHKPPRPLPARTADVSIRGWLTPDRDGVYVHYSVDFGDEVSQTLRGQIVESVYRYLHDEILAHAGPLGLVRALAADMEYVAGGHTDDAPPVVLDPKRKPTEGA